MGINQNHYKAEGARKAVEYIKSGMIVGLGSGSTVRFALEFIGQSLKDGKLRDVVGIPSSFETETLSKDLGIPLSTLDEFPEIDITIDGADEVDPQLNLIKGGGGALLREKILAQASRINIIIVDESKLSTRLGTRWAVPVEVLPFGRKPEARYIHSLGATVTLRKNSDDTPFTTDQGNLILDCHFGPIPEPTQIALKLDTRAAIMEHGLFIGLASEVIVAGSQGVRHLRREPV
ncbi:MAG: ribose-5-phosphate isomerase RpiA [Pseudomonadota bacterium]